MLLDKIMKNEFILKAKSLPKFSDSETIYYKNLDGHWTNHRNFARRLPEEIANNLAKYLSWEGVLVEVEKY